MTNDELDEIVADLRDEAATAAASEGDYYADQFTYHGCGEAADAITWLRAEIARLRLTDEEREAIKIATDFLEDEFYGCSDKCKAEHEAVATLRKLLERLT